MNIYCCSSVEPSPNVFCISEHRKIVFQVITCMFLILLKWNVNVGGFPLIIIYHSGNFFEPLSSDRDLFIRFFFIFIFLYFCLYLYFFGGIASS
jgi:hypothetical protein